MKISKLRIKNYRSIKDSGEILFTDKLFVLAGQNESGKSSILEALNAFESEESDKENLNFELENDGNLIQEIAVTYSDFGKEFYDASMKDIFEFIKSENEGMENLEQKIVYKEDIFQKITEFTIAKKFDFTSDKVSVITQLDKGTLGKVTGSIKDFEITETDAQGIISKKKKSYLDTELYAPDIAEALCQNTLEILFFNDFQILLPDKILLEELNNKDVEGIEAVKNISKLINKPFTEIAKKLHPNKYSITETESATLSTNFQQDWQQKIYGNNKVNIKFFIENNDQGQKEILFFVETKDNEYLAPRRRSKGMIWFLSLWLELKAKETSEKVKLISANEIENLFHVKDLMQLDSTIKEDNKKLPIEIIGERRKVVFAKMFIQKVTNGEIKKNNLNADTIRKFEEVFQWIETKFNKKLNSLKHN